MIAPIVKTTIEQAYQQAQSRPSWEDTQSAFQTQRHDIDRELAIELEMYLDFAERVHRFLQAAINGQVIAYDYVDQKNDCCCWHGWITDQQDMSASKSSQYVCLQLDFRGPISPIENWLFKSDEWSQNLPIPLTSTPFVVFLNYLVQYYERMFTA